MHGITKSFYGVPVLSSVDLDCQAGEIHAIVGENGAGKSTLMKILAGAYQPDAGTIRLNGREVHFGHPGEAKTHGVSLIYQEFTLLPERTVAQNIFLGREPRHGLAVDARAMDEASQTLLATLEADTVISPRALVRTLPVAQQQLVEIAKAMSFEARVLVMDEPTAALAPHEVDALFRVVRRLRERGLAILYISHRLKEIFALAERITVLKDGQRVATVRTADVTTGELVRMMVGRELDSYFPARATPAEIRTPKLRVRDAQVGALNGISFEVRGGEIVGIAGLEGSGQTELARALFGVNPFTAGSLEVNGQTLQVRSPRAAIRARMGYLTADRKAEGLVLPLPIRDNVLLALRGVSSRRRPAGISVPELVRQVDLRSVRPNQEVRFLSGGNQQKVVLAKWLATTADILIFDEPTRGIDVGAKAGIHELMRELARAGAAILMISSELPEVIGMSDRILVMRNGTIAGELTAGPSEADVMLLATGETESGVAA
jgi:ABC-type sugar transport system ATPase subunit